MAQMISQKTDFTSSMIGFLEEVKKTTCDLKDELVYHNGTGELIYVTDITTSQIVYMNKGLIDLFGDMTGMLCYEALQGFHESCEFCTNGIIRKNPTLPYKWFFYNRKVDTTFFIIDVCKEYRGRLLRVEKAYNIAKGNIFDCEELNKKIHGELR